MTTEHLCFDESGYLVCTVYRNRSKHWMLAFTSRNGASERIANLEAAKKWVAGLRHGKIDTWQVVERGQQ